MIRSYQDYLHFLEADRVALSRHRSVKNMLFDDIWKFQRLMRRLEYLVNCRKNPLLCLWVSHRYHQLGRELGFSIPINVFGPGLSIAHAGTIVVNPAARVGANCRLHVCVVIGTAAGKEGDAPRIGDECYIGPGVKIFGPIVIGNGVAIGANSVVNRSFDRDCITVAGVPAKIVSDKGSEGLLIRGHISGPEM